MRFNTRFRSFHIENYQRPLVSIRSSATTQRAEHQQTNRIETCSGTPHPAYTQQRAWQIASMAVRRASQFWNKIYVPSALTLDQGSLQGQDIQMVIGHFVKCTFSHEVGQDRAVHLAS